MLTDFSQNVRPMSNPPNEAIKFRKDTRFISGHPDSAFADDLVFESCEAGSNRIEIVVSRARPDRLEYLLRASGPSELLESVPLDTLAKAVRAGRPVLPNVLADMGHVLLLPDDATLIAYEEMDTFESFALAGVACLLVYEREPVSSVKPKGYRLTLKARGLMADYGVAVEVIAAAIDRGEPAIGHALAAHPNAVALAVEKISAACTGIQAAYQADVDKRHLAAAAPSNLGSGRKPPL